MKNKLPEGWKEVELGEVCELVMGQSPPGESYNETKNGTPFFQGKAEFNDKYPTIKKWTTQPCKLAKPNDILMSVRAPVGSINICNVNCCIGRGLAAIRCGKNITYDYLYLILKSLEEQVCNLGTGSTFKSITSKQLSSIKIPLPPLPTQKKIVSILEKAEALKQKREEADKKTKEYLQSVFVEMFLGKFEKMELGDEKIIDIQSGGTPSKTKKEYWENGTIPWIGSTACKDLPIYQAEQFITQKGLDNSSTKVFPKNTVLIALVGATIGKTGLLMFDCTTNQNIAGIIIKDKNKIDSTYLFFAIKQLYSKFTELSNDTFKMANLSFIRSLQIPLPPLSLQKKFAKIVEKVEKLKEKQKQSKEQIDNLFNSLMQKAFKGEIDV